MTRSFLTALLALAALLFAAAPALAQQPANILAGPPQASDYAPLKGEPFFLLSDAAYGSADVAQVRLEVPGRDFARANLEAYGGVDVLVYRVPEPVDFLKKQRNLHRIEVAGNFKGEGLANTLSFLWDSWWKQSRLLWRKLFSSEARRAVTKTEPALATSEAIRRPTALRPQPQYQPLQGYPLVERFRYPLWQAKPIAAPAGVKLEGSSSDFLGPSAGNIMIPLGKRKPGLYLVEAIIGEHRATTLVFVADTMAITKVSNSQMLVWAARRDNGAAVAGVDVAWTDGNGVLQSGTTGADGVLALERGSPEHTYVIGADRDGGVFVSENFYYDSEIYNTKIYAVTDRPLYRPGDDVNVKFLAREFTGARQSQPAAAAPLALTLFDPNGTPVLTQALQLQPGSGADTRFRLPLEAGAGGYELRFTYRDAAYGAAFRVAEYVKPHFEIGVLPAKPDYRTGEAVSGRIELRYPDGKPVANATLSLSLRSQQNAMVEGELRYSGLFPVQLKTQQLQTDGSGNADFSLPPAADPSRYIVTVLATDGAAYRVKTTRELMIERASNSYRLSAPRRFSTPGETVRFALDAVSEATPAASAADSRPVRWEMLQLETRAKTEGAFDPAKKSWDVPFAASGSYQLSLRDQHNNLVAQAGHWVVGDGVKAVPGSIEVLFDRERYRPGETAEALITFADPVEQALLTLERDRVEQVGLLAGGGAAAWMTARRVAPNQWRVSVPVMADYGPNITFSVAYTRHGDFVFQNAGLRIVEPRIALQFKTDKEVYQPGEKVTLDVSARLDGKPVSALVALGVVDEMVYVLQPEIAPEIGAFFYHPRRNNVRTTASLSFISYDLAAGRTPGAPARHNYNERGVKVLERPRRDEVDTAFWTPNLQTDADGHARVTFTMPDALTRWRITGRAIDADGKVGQHSAYLRSDKNFYAKWSAPDWMRAGDAPLAAVAVFNQGATEQALEVTLTSAAGARTEKLSAKRGVNHVHFALAANGGALRLEVKRDGKLVDALDTTVQTLPATWSSARSLALPLTGAATALPLPLPPDARRVRLSFAQGASGHFARIADDLIDMPRGGVDATASRLIPLALALQNLGPEAGAARERVLATLQAQRLRLVAMAGPKAQFGWWGKLSAGDPLMTAYAYYADWFAARALNIALPPEHWQNLLAEYAARGLQAPPLERALILWMAQEMGLPVKTLAAGLADDIGANVNTNAPAATRQAPNGANALRGASLLLGPDNGDSDAVTLALLALVAQANTLALAPELQQRVEQAWTTLRASRAPLAQALLMLAGQVPATQADTILAGVRADTPSLDRALTLAWVQKKLGPAPIVKTAQPALAAPWQPATSRLGQPFWRWTGAGAPTQLQLSEAPAPNGVAMLEYDSTAAETPALAVQIERKILRLTRQGDGYDAVPVKNGEALRTDALYLDSVTLRPAAGARHRYGVLEVALPPGAAVEATTWGIAIKGVKSEALERARHEERRDGYAVPIDSLGAPLTVRHLLRFSQGGSYVLPPARYYRLYQPEQKAFEGDGRTARALRVE